MAAHLEPCGRCVVQCQRAAMRRVEDDDAVVSVMILEDGAVCEVEEVEGGRKARIEFSEERLRVPA